MQQMNLQLLGLPGVLNGAIPGLQQQDPNFRFAVPQHIIPMGMQQRVGGPSTSAQDQQQLVNQLNLALNPQLLQRVQLQQQQAVQQAAAQQAQAAQAKPNGQGVPQQQQAVRPGQPQVKQEPNTFEGHPDFQKTLHQALSAMHAIDPQLMNVNLSSLSNGLSGMPMMMNGLAGSLTPDAQRLLLQRQQLQQHQQAAQRLLQQPQQQPSPPKANPMANPMAALLQSQLRNFQNPQLKAEEQRKLSVASMSQQPKTSVPTTSRSQSTCSANSATPQLSARGTPFAQSKPASKPDVSNGENSQASLVKHFNETHQLAGKASFMKSDVSIDILYLSLDIK